MESRVKLLGHPVHPMLIVLPLGLLSAGVLFDAAYLVTGTRELAHVAFWNISLGIVGGLLAAVAGLIDWMAIPRGTRARRVGAWHGGGNAVIVVLFVISWLLRQGNVEYAPDVLPFVLGLVGIGLALLTAWLGGELVYRLGVAVDRDANLDASNSLQRETTRGRDEGSDEDTSPRAA